MVMCGSDAIVQVPAARWDLDAQPALHEPVSGRMRHGGFVRGAQLADNAAFAVSPAEAAAMDPCQRLLLERGYIALHDAALDRTALGGSLTGVFLGFLGTEFAQLLAASPAGGSVYAATGSSASIASGRLSYALGLHGPCVSYDTACSAALVAGHAALRALQLAECSVSLIEGVNLVLAPGVGTSFAIAGMTSARGRSHTFDERADGYARGEAFGGVALRRGGDAARRELGLLGSAVRQDGWSASLTAPNGQAQRVLLVAAMRDAETSVDALALSEAHGTGTALGDPIEAGSLAAAVLTPREVPLAVGGVKANVGHAEPAAGMTGLLKLVLGMWAGEATPNAQLRALNPHLSGTLRSVNCALLVQLAALFARGSQAGGVSSFGYSGTIAHAMLCSSGLNPHFDGYDRAPLRQAPLAYRRYTLAWRAPPHPFIQRQLASSDGSTILLSPLALGLCLGEGMKPAIHTVSGENRQTGACEFRTQQNRSDGQLVKFMWEGSRGIGVIELNDFTHFNALGDALCSDLAKTIDHACTHPSACCLVLQAAGAHFSIGANPHSKHVDMPLQLLGGGLFAMAWSCCKLREHSGSVVSAVHGYLVGGGIALCLNTSYTCAHSANSQHTLTFPFSHRYSQPADLFVSQYFRCERKLRTWQSSSRCACLPPFHPIFSVPIDSNCTLTAL
jgi:3-oxoacyl-(acyl-carrier-protein) synthase